VLLPPASPPLPPVLTGHVSSLLPYESDTSHLMSGAVFDPAVQLYQKAGQSSKALELCFSAKLFDSLRLIADDLTADTDPALMGKVAFLDLPFVEFLCVVIECVLLSGRRVLHLEPALRQGGALLRDLREDPGGARHVRQAQGRPALALAGTTLCACSILLFLWPLPLPMNINLSLLQTSLQVTMTETMAEKITDQLPEKDSAGGEFRIATLRRMAGRASRPSRSRAMSLKEDHLKEDHFLKPPSSEGYQTS